MIQQLWHGSCCCWVMVTMGDGMNHAGTPRQFHEAVSFQLSPFHSATNLYKSTVVGIVQHLRNCHKTVSCKKWLETLFKFSYNTVCGKKIYFLHFLFPGPIKDSIGLTCWRDDFWDQCRPPLSSSLSVPVHGSAVFVAVSGFRHLLAPFSLVYPSTALHPTPPIPTSQLPLSPA